MTTGHVFIATSLDGFIARKSGAIDWLVKQPTAGEEHGYDTFMESVDGLVMGRGSYQKVLTFDPWPYAKPVIVMSRTLGEQDVPEHLRSKVHVTKRSPSDVMAMLRDEGWTRAYIDGGKVVQSFLREGLITDMTVTRVPILIGDGRPLFGSLDHDIDLEHIETRSFPSGLVTSHYRVVGKVEKQASVP